MGNKQISDYLNSHNIKTPTGKDYTRHLIGMYFYKSRKIERRLKHSELKITNIRHWIGNIIILTKDHMFHICTK